MEVDSKVLKRTVAEMPPPSTTPVHNKWRRLCSKITLLSQWMMIQRLMINLGFSITAFMCRSIQVMTRFGADVEDLTSIQEVLHQSILEEDHPIQVRHHLRESNDHYKEKKEKHLKKEKKKERRQEELPVDKASLGSFEMATNYSGRKKTESSKKGAATTTALIEPNMMEMCFCGMVPTEYTCYKQGPNWMRRFLRCPKSRGAQCRYFMWLEEEKANGYQQLPPRSQQVQKPSSALEVPVPGTTSSSDSEQSFKSDNSSVKGVPTSAVRRTGHPESSSSQRCDHQWSRRGTNSHVKMKTCKICGLRETTHLKTGQVTRSVHTDVSPRKK